MIHDDRMIDTVFRSFSLWFRISHTNTNARGELLRCISVGSTLNFRNNLTPECGATSPVLLAFRTSFATVCCDMQQIFVVDSQ